MKTIYLSSIAVVFCFIMCSCGGASAPTDASNTPATAAKPSGEAIYKRTCITCHQPNGEGLPNTYPPLAKSDFLSDKEKVITQVIKGFTGELTV